MFCCSREFSPTPDRVRLTVFIGGLVLGSAMAGCGAEQGPRSADNLSSSIVTPTRQQLLEVFDWRYYLGRYPSLVAAGYTTQAQAEEHWLNFGIREARQPSGFFSIRGYIRAYVSLAKRSDMQHIPEFPNYDESDRYRNQQAILHYVTIGKQEKLVGVPFDPALYNYKYYRRKNADLADLPEFRPENSGRIRAARHWVLHGMKEGRTASPYFSVSSYIADPKVAGRVTANDYLAAIRDYVSQGICEQIPGGGVAKVPAEYCHRVPDNFGAPLEVPLQAASEPIGRPSGVAMQQHIRVTNWPVQSETYSSHATEYCYHQSSDGSWTKDSAALQSGYILFRYGVATWTLSGSLECDARGLEVNPPFGNEPIKTQLFWYKPNPSSYINPDLVIHRVFTDGSLVPESITDDTPTDLIQPARAVNYIVVKAWWKSFDEWNRMRTFDVYENCHDPSGYDSYPTYLGRGLSVSPLGLYLRLTQGHPCTRRSVTIIARNYGSQTEQTVHYTTGPFYVYPSAVP